MVRTVSIRELKAKASEIVREVSESRQQVAITLRGREVARIFPTRAISRKEVDEWNAKADELAERIGRLWPKGVSAAQAISEDRSRLDGP